MRFRKITKTDIKKVSAEVGQSPAWSNNVITTGTPESMPR